MKKWPRLVPAWYTSRADYITKQNVKRVRYVELMINRRYIKLVWIDLTSQAENAHYTHAHLKHNENYQLIGDGDKFLEWGILRQESEVSCDSTFMIRKLLQRTVDYPRGKVSGLTDYRVNLDVTRSAPLEISKWSSLRCQVYSQVLFSVLC